MTGMYLFLLGFGALMFTILGIILGVIQRKELDKEEIKNLEDLYFKVKDENDFLKKRLKEVQKQVKEQREIINSIYGVQDQLKGNVETLKQITTKLARESGC